jgi:hypothetical protein
MGTAVPESSTVASVRIRRSYSQAARRTFRESTSWFDVFDWKFEKYLTPWIIRLTWIATLGVSALWIVGILILTVMSLAPEVTAGTASKRNRERGDSEIEYEIRAPKVNMERMQRPIIAICSAATACIGVLIGLLWTRVILECAIVLFNMANSLTNIEDHFRNREG